MAVHDRTRLTGRLHFFYFSTDVKVHIAQAAIRLGAAMLRRSTKFRRPASLVCIKKRMNSIGYF
jgi:hypothetical protein